jgi:hypothetical protein
VTAAIPLTLPAVAVRPAVPLPTATARPAASTVTTAGAFEDQETGVESVWDDPFVTVAESETVSPRDTRSAVAGVTTTAVGVSRSGPDVGEEHAPHRSVSERTEPATIARRVYCDALVIPNLHE